MKLTLSVRITADSEALTTFISQEIVSFRTVRDEVRTYKEWSRHTELPGEASTTLAIASVVQTGLQQLRKRVYRQEPF